MRKRVEREVDLVVAGQILSRRRGVFNLHPVGIDAGRGKQAAIYAAASAVSSPGTSAPCATSGRRTRILAQTCTTPA